jgi:hypothetical protein
MYGHKKRPKHQQDLEKQNNNKETLKDKSLSVGGCQKWFLKEWHTWTWVFISLARSAYLRVLTVWWYWSSAGDIVATITVCELPLNPSFKMRVNLLREKIKETGVNQTVLNYWLWSNGNIYRTQTK